MSRCEYKSVSRLFYGCFLCFRFSAGGPARGRPLQLAVQFCTPPRGGSEPQRLEKSARSGSPHVAAALTLARPGVIDAAESTVDSAASISAPRFSTDRKSTSGCHGDEPVRHVSRLSAVDCQPVQSQPAKSRCTFPTRVVLVRIVPRTWLPW